MSEFKFLRVLLTFSLIVVMGWFLYAVRSVLMPFVLAGILAYALSPLVTAIELRGVRRSVAVVFLYSGLSIVGFFFVYWLVNLSREDLPRLQAQLPEYITHIKASAAKAEITLSEKFEWFRDKNVLGTAAQYVTDFAKSGVSAIPKYISSFFSVALYFILIPFVSFFVLQKSRDVIQGMLDRCPGRWVEKFLSLFYEMAESMGNYVRGRLLESLIVGGLTTIGLAVLGIDYFFLIGIIAGLVNLVPYLGPFAGGLLGISMAFFQFHNLAMPIKVAVVFGIVQFIDNWILQPVIMKKSVDLHPVLVIFVLMCGGTLAGVWGLIFAVPIACILKVIIQVSSMWYASEYGGRYSSDEFKGVTVGSWIV